jgi:hypothetical protein
VDYKSNKKKRVKLSHYKPWMRLGGERRYSSYSFSTLALDGGERSASCPSRALPPGKGPPVPIGQEAGWAPEPIWTQRPEEKSFASVGDQTPVTQSVVRHYTDWATLAPIKPIVQDITHNYSKRSRFSFIRDITNMTAGFADQLYYHILLCYIPNHVWPSFSENICYKGSCNNIHVTLKN